ncbi:MAG TPA: hypothetical protein VFN49_10950 [Candidatus Aquilonibacter sp.]|nr:hypothetical protein [Candidatus Aquilonibacter sp.]
MAASQTGSSGRVTIRPHRSYRTLRVSQGSWIGTLATLPVGLAVAYTFLTLALPKATAAVFTWLSANTPLHTSVEDNFLWIGSTVPAPSLPPLSVVGALDVAGGCVALVIAIGLLRQNTPLALWFQANVIVLMFSALWAFFEGRVGYDGPTFMLLIERTSVIMILCSPVFAVIVSALLPFSSLERALMLVGLVAVGFVLALVRLAAFALLLTHFGVIAEANLYMFFGPLIDVVYFIVIYSLGVVSLSHRIARGEHVWDWL